MRVLQWAPSWLQEQRDSKVEPPVRPKGTELRPVPTTFPTYNDYCAVLYPLMMNDLWGTVYQEYSTREEKRDECGQGGILIR